jgi:hypothetical protein
MNWNISFIRKVIYIAAIALLLIPLSWLSQPATKTSSKSDPDGMPATQTSSQSAPGGKLAQLRTQYNLSQAELGEIDPASETMKLCTLGMRGVAANILWSKANEYKKTEDWNNLSATLNQITKLQPNFISVWEFQAHNLSYNVSVEFDDYRHRYHWVKKGIEFLITGTLYNRNEPRLYHTLGWFFGQKIGRADEQKQFRRMFRSDTDFQNYLANYVNVDDAKGANGYCDNWLMGRLWYLIAQTIVDTKAAPIRGTAPLIFHSHPAMSLINYAMAIEDDGILGEVAKVAWQDAGREWQKFGLRQIPSSYGHTIALGAKDTYEQQAADLLQRLDALAPGVRERLAEEKRASLTEPERAAMNAPAGDWTDAQADLFGRAQQKMHITHQEVAERAPAPVRKEALIVAAELQQAELMADRIRHYRATVNYDYWQTRCEAEASETAISAREHLYEAGQLYEQAILESYTTKVKEIQPDGTEVERDVRRDGARELYEKAWDEWGKVFDKYPVLLQDIPSPELITAIRRYRTLLEKIDVPFPEPFKLQPLLDAYNVRNPEPE